MAWRKLMVENPARISTRGQQLLIAVDEERSVPIEDIDAVLIENGRTVVSAASLAHLAQNGSAVFICDEKHMPCGVLVPFSQHSRQLTVSEAQQALSAPRKKRLWQQIVTSKVRNQAICAGIVGDGTAEKQLYHLIATIQSGDATNVEATAAACYFSTLFGSTFTRSGNDGRNACLNYGYACLRGLIARDIAVYGFLPHYGLHHKSGLNAFNLADDLIEPFRPVVDLFVLQNYHCGSVLDTDSKRGLVALLNADVLSGGQVHSVSYAIERTVQSLSAVCRGEKNELLLPELVPLALHNYE